MQKSIEEITQEIKEDISKNDTKIVNCWNFLFEEEKIQEKYFDDSKIKEEVIDIICEEAETLTVFETVETLYDIATGNKLTDIFHDDLNDWEDDDWDE